MCNCEILVILNGLSLKINVVNIKIIIILCVKGFKSMLEKMDYVYFLIFILVIEILLFLYIEMYLIVFM